MNRVSFWNNDKFLEMGGNDSCTTIWIYLMQLNYTLKIFVVLIILCCIFYHNFSKWGYGKDVRFLAWKIEMFLKGAKTDSQVAQTIKSLPAVQETQVQSLGCEDPLEKEMATHSSILAWKILWREESGRLQSMGLQRIKQDRATSLSLSLSRLILNVRTHSLYSGFSLYSVLPLHTKKLYIRGINDFPRFHFRNTYIYIIEISYFVFMFCSWNVKFKANFNQLNYRWLYSGS